MVRVPRSVAWLKRIDDRLRSAGRDAVPRDVSAFEEVAIKARRGQGFAIVLGVLLHWLDVQLSVADGFGLLQILAIRAPNHFDRVGRQAFARRARIVGPRFWRRHRRDRTAASVRISFNKLCSPWAWKFMSSVFAPLSCISESAFRVCARMSPRAISARQALISIEIEIHIDRMSFGGMPGCIERR